MCAPYKAEAMSKDAAGLVVPIPTLPFKTVLPVPLGVRVTFWFEPPAANVNALVPVMDPVAPPVPPCATASVPEVMAVALNAGISAATNVLKVGLPADPFGAASTRFAACEPNAEPVIEIVEHAQVPVGDEKVRVWLAAQLAGICAA